MNLEKKYYVAAGCLLKSVVATWASQNGMKLIGEDVSLPTCPRAYELDVSCNDDLRVGMRLLGSGRPDFRNGDKVIGHVTYDDAPNVQRVVIYPEIRDR